jgi:hypothetical protein
MLDPAAAGKWVLYRANYAAFLEVFDGHDWNASLHIDRDGARIQERINNNLLGGSQHCYQASSLEEFTFQDLRVLVRGYLDGSGRVSVA